MRGVPFINIPTSLLAMVDSSIGGKNGVDLPEGKNLLGTFNQPEAVIVNYKYLHTLPKAELINGLAEIIKYGLIADVHLLEYIEKNVNSIFELNSEALELLITRSCSIKKRFIEGDEKENDKRKILNFGHTIGHALEHTSDFAISHGNAVSAGMVFDIWFSSKLYGSGLELFKRSTKLLNAVGLLYKIPSKYDVRELVEYIKVDKKSDGQFIDYIFLPEIGKPVVKSINIGAEIYPALLEYKNLPTDIFTVS